MKASHLFIVFVLSISTVFCQSKIKCQVIHEELTGTYIGECKNGKADGRGEFTFADGAYVYVGHFKAGKMDGKGEILSVNNKKRVSVTKGIWEDNVYAGDNSRPYDVKRTANLDRYTVNKKPMNDNSVMINFYQNGVRNNVSDLNIVVNNGTRIVGNYTAGFENIIFPFICQVNYRTQNKFKTTTYNVVFEIVINEPGSWELFLYN